MQDDGLIAGTLSPATRGLRQPNWCLWGSRCTVTQSPSTALGTLPFKDRSRQCFPTLSQMALVTDLLGDQGKPPSSLRLSFLICQLGILTITLCAYIHSSNIVDKTKCWWEQITPERSPTAAGMWILITLWKTVWWQLLKLTYLYPWPRGSSPGYLTTRNESTCSPKNIQKNMHNIDKSHIIRWKPFVLQRTPLRKWKDNVQNRRKYLHIRYLIRDVSRICKELLELNNNNKTQF